MPLTGLIRERRADRVALHLARDLALIAVWMRPEDDTTAAELRSAGRTLARAASALLAVGLAVATAHLPTGLGAGVALSAVGELGRDDLMQQPDVDRRAEDVAVELVLANHLAAHIVDVCLRHLFSPDLRPSPKRPPRAWPAPAPRGPCGRSLQSRWGRGPS